MTSSRRKSRPSQIGKYRLLHAIGAGGMGTVYKAMDEEGGREVALKVLSAGALQRADWIERFRREAQLGLRLRHDHLVHFLDWGECGDSLFLAMEFVDGPDLMQMIELQGKLAPRLAARILRHMAAALDYICQEGIVHRDIKPSNILLHRREEKFHAKLGDLGLARLSADEDCRITREGNTVGTIDYMAPEQARNSGVADIRSDLYSLGCTLFHMLTGQPPFNTGAMIDRVMAHATKAPPDVRELNPEVPPRLASICARLMAKHPDQRFQRPADLVKALAEKSQLAANATSASPAALPTTPQPPSEASSEMKAPSVAASVRPPSDAEQPASQKRVAHFLFEQALQVLRSEQPAYAIRLLFKCCRLDPAHVEYHEALRQAQHEMRALSPSPHWWDSLSRGLTRMRFRLAQWKGWSDSALCLGERLLYWRPDDLDLHVELARAAEQGGHDDLAIWLLEQARRLDKENVGLLRALADSHEKRGQLEQALAYYEKIGELLPDSPQVQRKIQELSANQTMMQGDFENRLRSHFRPRRRQVG